MLLLFSHNAALVIKAAWFLHPKLQHYDYFSAEKRRVELPKALLLFCTAIAYSKLFKYLFNDLFKAHLSYELF